MKRLKMIRLARKKTIKHMADRFGVTEGTWMRYEKGQTDPKPEMRNAIADYLNVTLDQLAGREPFVVEIEEAS